MSRLLPKEESTALSPPLLRFSHPPAASSSSSSSSSVYFSSSPSSSSFHPQLSPPHASASTSSTSSSSTTYPWPSYRPPSHTTASTFPCPSSSSSCKPLIPEHQPLQPSPDDDCGHPLLPHAGSPAAFCVACWLLCTQACRQLLISLIPRIGTRAQWEMLADVYVYLGIVLGLPPRSSDLDLALLGPKDRLKETLWEESHSRSHSDKLMSLMVLILVATPFLFVLLHIAYVVCAGPLRKLLLEPAWGFCKRNELEEQMLYLAAFGSLTLAVRLTPLSSPAPGLAIALLLFGEALLLVAWQKTMNVNEPFRAVPKAGAQASLKELKGVRRAVLKRRLKRQAVGAMLQAMVAAPLALALQCSWLGATSVLAALSAAVLLLSLPNYGEGSFGQQLERLVLTIAGVSLGVAVAGAVANRTLGAAGCSDCLLPFSTGVCLFGHSTFFASRLALTSSRLPSAADDGHFRTRQQQFVVALAVAAALGWGADLQSLKSASVLFTLAWLALREYEAKKAIAHPLHLAVKLAATASVLWYVANSFSEVAGLLDGTRLYTP